MKCIQAQDYLDDYLLGELEPEIEIKLNTHLEECETCKQKVQEREVCLKEMKNVIKYTPPQSAYRRIKLTGVPVQKERILWVFPKQLVYLFGAFLFGIIIMRIADSVLVDKREIPQVEMYRVPSYQQPASDTVQFYTAPVKHLARS